MPTSPKAPGRVLISAVRIRRRIRELAREITRHYDGRPLTVVGLMNGSLFFLVDLLRHLPPTTQIECWRVYSYKGRRSSGSIQGLDHHAGDYRGRHVLIIDDILDTGLTVHSVSRKIRENGARSVKLCVLLDKKRKRSAPAKADWSGFPIQDQFVIGYGLDLDHAYRTLPDVRVLD
jgi:hypoxanthine phosphoribosyltransferase